MKRPGIVLILVLSLVACHPPAYDIVVLNTTDSTLDFLYLTPFRFQREDWEHYESLQVGDRDYKLTCYGCGLAPGAEFVFDEELDEAMQLFFIARSTDGEIVFKAIHGIDDLQALDWRVELTDQREMR